MYNTLSSLETALNQADSVYSIFHVNPLSIWLQCHSYEIQRKSTEALCHCETRTKNTLEHCSRMNMYNKHNIRHTVHRQQVSKACVSSFLHTILKICAVKLCI